MAAVGLLRRRAPWLCAVLGALALALSGCTSGAASSGTAGSVAGSTLDVWSSEPPGPGDTVSADVLGAEQLALKQAGGKAGAFTVALRIAHEREISANAREAVQDKRAIAYLGEVDPGTSGVSLQITNQIGLLQVSPTDTAAYLTQSTPAVPDSPGHYYPTSSTYHRTFARMVPTTAQETKALARAIKAQGVSRLYVTGDHTVYGASVALALRDAARGQGITLASGASGADGVAYAGLDRPAARAALDQAAAADPQAKLFATSSLYDDALVAALSPAAQRRLTVSSPGEPASGQVPPATQSFQSAFRSAYGHAPEPQAVYGYEAMSALLASLKGLGAQARDRSKVVARVRGLHDRAGAFGTYSLTGGDVDLASFVLARVVDGKLVPRSAS